jgi:glyoxylase-like metal-dependent hydrolase (beta-lactamase superfamily II)
MIMHHTIDELPNITRIDLKQQRTGFRNFINAWLFRDQNLVFLVDPGPLNSTETLIETLRQLDVQHIDHILLTHIHIDHAGGTGRLLEVYPEARVNCHPKGIDHLIDPAKLWQGSLKVLGPVAEAYGEIVPVPADRIGYQPEIIAGPHRLTVIDTPGHAVHHQSYRFGDILFAGEVAGVSHAVGDSFYARPATPPRFRLETSLASLDRVIAEKPGMICFGHHGHRRDAMAALQMARTQLLQWTAIVREELSSGTEGLDQRIVERLRHSDDAFALFERLDDDIRQRETYFIGNTLAGMREYISAGVSTGSG